MTMIVVKLLTCVTRCGVDVTRYCYGAAVIPGVTSRYAIPTLPKICLSASALNAV